MLTTNTDDHLSDFVTEPIANSQESLKEKIANNAINSSGSSPKQGIFGNQKFVRIYIK